MEGPIAMQYDSDEDFIEAMVSLPPCEAGDRLLPTDTIMDAGGMVVGVWAVTDHLDGKAIISGVVTREGVPVPIELERGCDLRDVAACARKTMATYRVTDGDIIGDLRATLKLFGFFGPYDATSIEWFLRQRVGCNLFALPLFPAKGPWTEDVIQTSTNRLKLLSFKYRASLSPGVAAVLDMSKNCVTGAEDLGKRLVEIAKDGAFAGEMIRNHPALAPMMAHEFLRRPISFGSRDEATTIAMAVRNSVSPRLDVPVSFGRALAARSDVMRQAAMKIGASQLNMGWLKPRAWTAATVLSSLPENWMPDTVDEWSSLLEIADALQTKIDSLSAIELESSPFVRFPETAVAINARGRWSEFKSRLVSASGVAGSAELVDAVRGHSDFTERFANQVIAPALALGYGADASVTLDDLLSPGYVVTATRMLSRGRSLPRQLENSRKWHGRLHAMDATIAALTPAFDDGRRWPSGLPSARIGDVDIVVLTSTAELKDEGNVGHNADGSSGLSHCVGGYTRTCREGKKRILSLRRSLPNGSYERLSTASVTTTRTFEISEHSGMRNMTPLPEASAALEKYVNSLNAGTMKVDWPGLAPLPTADSVAQAAGYDWTVPGAWDAALAQWATFLPRPMRTWSSADFAAEADKWRPQKWDLVWQVRFVKLWLFKTVRKAYWRMTGRQTDKGQTFGKRLVRG